MTLYVTDLDGTLLGKDSKVSPRSVGMLREALERGAHISIATARTPATVSRLLKEVPLQLPAIVMTGAVMWMPGTMHYISPQYIPSDTMQHLYEIYRKHGLPLFVYRKPGGLIEIDHYGPVWEGEKDFVAQRQGSPYKRFHSPIASMPSRLQDNANTLLCFSMQRGETIHRAYEEIRKLPGINAVCYHDIFGPEVAMLEVMSATASKASALRRLREHTGAQKIVAFGDNVNDLPMFAEADRRIAVANALPEVQQHADLVIGPNTDDSVARYILEDIGG